MALVVKDWEGCGRCENDSLPNIKWVLDLAKAAVLRHGVRGLVIDPYNELDHQRPANQSKLDKQHMHTYKTTAHWI
ncbi:Twinkle-like protein, chloroplastic/mitochondrial [Vitis vinifera]|uniref:Twinkle-like protein, chloroplastic/mitochondrial n=1 Tax=Vitis vinifera TaxID=29760 RepID=A0A438K4A5_VITVI|nr:Twinkle-like protein, chloroplastic/mitochondrial [Vitis vinifera]